MAILLNVKPDIPPGEWLPLQEAAAWYAVDPSTLYRLMKAGRLTRHRRLGDKRTYLKIEELERALRPQPVDG